MLPERRLNPASISTECATNRVSERRSGQSGEVRTFTPGDIFLAADLTGQGHRLRAGPDGALQIAIPLESS